MSKSLASSENKAVHSQRTRVRSPTIQALECSEFKDDYPRTRSQGMPPRVKLGSAQSLGFPGHQTEEPFRSIPLRACMVPWCQPARLGTAVGAVLFEAVSIFSRQRGFWATWCWRAHMTTARAFRGRPSRLPPVRGAQHTSFGVEGARPTGNKIVLASPSLPSRSRLSKTSSLPAIRSSSAARPVDYLLDRFS